MLFRITTAAALAVATLFGTTTATLGEPATACAAPKAPGFDRDGFHWCADLMDGRWNRGEITFEEWDEAVTDCCYRYGGIWEFRADGFEGCVDPADSEEGPAPPAGGPIATFPNLPPVQTR